MGLCMSYNEFEKIDRRLAERVINAAQSHRTPIPPIIGVSVMIHGVMDNFDHEENAPSGIEGSHDTILMLFQNGNDTLKNAAVQISQVPNSLFPQKKSLEHIMDCQKIIRRVRFSGRGQIPDSFTLITRIAFPPIIPYPATGFDTVHTAVIDYQDVLFKKHLPYGPPWSGLQRSYNSNVLRNLVISSVV